MSKLIKKAAAEALEYTKLALSNLTSMIDNINDIKLHLDHNKKHLPENGEVGIDELLKMMSACIDKFERVESQIKQANGWIDGIINN